MVFCNVNIFVQICTYVKDKQKKIEENRIKLSI
mgnify:CR=1 FL=1